MKYKLQKKIAYTLIIVVSIFLIIFATRDITPSAHTTHINLSLAPLAHDSETAKTNIGKAEEEVLNLN